MVPPRATLRVRVNKKIYVRSARVVLPEFAKGRKLNGVGGQKGRRANHGKAGEGHGEAGWRGEVAGRGSTRNDNVQLQRGVMPLTPTHAETEADGDGDGGRLLVLLLMVAAGHRDWGQGRGCDPGGVLVTVAAANADDVLELLLPGPILALLITVVGAG